jgi:hypothetical protein
MRKLLKESGKKFLKATEKIYKDKEKDKEFERVQTYAAIAPRLKTAGVSGDSSLLEREEPKELFSGRKFDENKDRWDLLPWKEVQDVVKVLTKGAIKYSDNNWQEVWCAKDRYFAAAMRHLTAHRAGELIDPESSLPHLAHAACNLLFQAWFDNQKK